MFKFRYAPLFLSLAALLVADSCNSRDVGSCGDVKTDTKNCGTCGHECNSGEFCDNGVCKSSCSQTTCKDGEQLLCVDLKNDPNNCGSCGNKCGEGNLCEDGKCKSKCDSPKFYCTNGENDAEKLCIDPASNDTCGVKSCDDVKTIARCEEGFVCQLAGGEYGCACESGIVVESEKEDRITKKCIDPSTNVHCGATADNPDGMVCGEGTICLDYQYTDSENNVQIGYHCSCAATWELSCYSAVNASAQCLDTATSQDHCSAKDCADTSFACGTDRTCKAGICECQDNLVECNGKCIDPLKNEEGYCGAKGACTDNDPASENYRGKQCGENEGCVNGDCVCDPQNLGNYVQCNGQCIENNTDTACIITKNTDGSCNILDCTKDGKICKLSDETGNHFCGCPENTVKCGDACIDPQTDIHHCGAALKGSCNSGVNGNNNYKGEDCSLRTDRNTLCVAGKCENECPDGQVDCNGECVNKNKYHVNDTCDDCGFLDGYRYCYTGERENGEIIDFDYHKCLLRDENGKDTNILFTNNYCGNTCDDAKACVNGFTCNGNTCVCRGENMIPCPIKKSDDENAEAEEFCINKKDTHQVDCGVCEEGWADADGDLLNGCEIDTNNDVKNCGAIGNNCTASVKNATGIFCNNGKCDYAYCTADHGDCDVERTNGCEKSGLTSDNQNCGACGRVCEGGSCVNSVCCDGSGKTAAKADDLNCCEGLNKYRYTHSSWNEDKACTDVSHYSCLSANPNEACWQIVE